MPLNSHLSFVININIMDFYFTLGFDNGICKFGDIVRLFGDKHKSVLKGQNAIQSNHAISVMQNPENNI